MLLALAPIYVAVANEHLVLLPLLLLTAVTIFVSARLALLRQYEATRLPGSPGCHRRVL